LIDKNKKEEYMQVASTQKKESTSFIKNAINSVNTKTALNLKPQIKGSSSNINVANVNNTAKKILNQTENQIIDSEGNLSEDSYVKTEVLNKIEEMKAEELKLLERQMKRMQKEDDRLIYKRSKELHILQIKVKKDKEIDSKNNFLSLRHNLIKRYLYKYNI